LKTIDGGAHWTFQNSDVAYSLKSFFFTDANTGYAAGGGSTGGKILKTTNGGAIWTGQFAGTTNYLNSVFFTDSNTGYAVGEYGTIMKTTDGGNLWSSRPSGTFYSLYSVYFTDANTGYAVGGGDIILKTIDGGTNWVILYQGSTSGVFFSICFPQENVGYAVGENINPMHGTILKTINGGADWTSQESGTGNSLQSVFFTDVNTGYAVGGFGDGIILKTTDGGTSWVGLTSGTSKALYAVYFPKADTGYAVGENGTILKTINGGGVGIDETSADPTHFKIYPNPASELISIESPVIPGITRLTVSDLQGRVLKEMEITGLKSQIDIRDLPSGIYFLTVKNAKMAETLKLIKR
jgi:photosystem II stability/assembly factor-like uncharacterized protein